MLSVFRKTIRAWRHDHAGQLGAATAYYTVFSIAPFLILIIALAGLLLDPSTAEEEIFGQLRSFLGEAGVEPVRDMVRAAQASDQTPLAAILGVIFLLYGASSLMVALQHAMNQIWDVEPNPKHSGWAIILSKRLFSLAMILTFSFLFLVSLIVTAMVGYIVGELASYAPILAFSLPLSSFILSFAFTTALFALMYKYLPDISIPWRAIWPGALLASLLFTLGKFLLGFYLGQRDFTATYGVAGSVVLLLLWINYSSQILYFGAEFTEQYAAEKKIKVIPSKFAIFTDTHGRVIRTKPSLFQKLKIVLRVLLFESKMGFKLWRWKRHRKR